MALAVRGGLRVTCGTRGLRQRWRPDPTWLKARSTAPFTHPGSEGMGSREWGQWQKCSGLERRQSK